MLDAYTLHVGHVLGKVLFQVLIGRAIVLQDDGDLLSFSRLERLRWNLFLRVEVIFIGFVKLIHRHFLEA